MVAGEFQNTEAFGSQTNAFEVSRAVESCEGPGCRIAEGTTIAWLFFGEFFRVRCSL